RLLKHAIRIGTTKDHDDILMDFFAGSGPSLHGMLSLNAEDGGNRKFVAVQIAETLPVVEDRAKSISDFMVSRLKNLGQKLIAGEHHEEWSKDIGFRSFRIDSGNFVDTSVTPKEATQEELLGMVSHIKDD